MKRQSIKTATIDTKSVDKLSRILGAFDENLDLIVKQLEIVAYVEGVKIRMEGEEENVAQASAVFRALLKAVENGEVIDEGKIVYCVELAKEGKADEITAVSSGTVAITARGKQIKCKTVGQQAYVDAIKKNTVIFGVGPAGTGKTYLAVCMAVSAFKAKQVEKIILTRPAVEAGEKLGFLPGDLQTKGNLCEIDGTGRDRSCTACLYAWQNAFKCVYHFGRSAKYDERTNENVFNAYG